MSKNANGLMALIASIVLPWFEMCIEIKWTERYGIMKECVDSSPRHTHTYTHSIKLKALAKIIVTIVNARKIYQNCISSILFISFVYYMFPYGPGWAVGFVVYMKNKKQFNWQFCSKKCNKIARIHVFQSSYTISQLKSFNNILHSVWNISYRSKANEITYSHIQNSIAKTATVAIV